jgi:ribosomal protein S18 acetylase RimI-like enzyme
MEIRAMRDGDLDAVADLYLAAYGVDWSRAGARAYVEKFFRFEPLCCLVTVESNGSVSGSVLGYSFERETGVTLYLQELMVHPGHRNKGYGKNLVAKLRESLAKSANLVKSKPLVKADTTVLNFYNSLGFEKDVHVSFSLDID